VVWQDYMDNVRGKEVSLLRTTVKIPGQRPRGSEALKTTQQTNGQPVNQGDEPFHRINLSVCLGVPQRQPHRRSGLATLPSVGAVPQSPRIIVD